MVDNNKSSRASYTLKRDQTASEAGHKNNSHRSQHEETSLRLNHDFSRQCTVSLHLIWQCTLWPGDKFGRIAHNIPDDQTNSTDHRDNSKLKQTTQLPSTHTRASHIPRQVPVMAGLLHQLHARPLRFAAVSRPSNIMVSKGVVSACLLFTHISAFTSH